MSEEYLQRFRNELHNLGIDRRSLDRISTEVADHIAEASERDSSVDLNTLMGSPSELALQFQDALWTRALQHSHRLLIGIGGAALALVTTAEGVFGWTDSWPVAGQSTSIGLTAMRIGVTITFGVAYLMLHGQPSFGRTPRQWQIVRAFHRSAVFGTTATVVGLGLWTTAQVNPPVWWILAFAASASALLASATFMHRVSSRLGALATHTVGEDETFSQALSEFWRPTASATPYERPLVLGPDLTLVPADVVLDAKREPSAGAEFFRAHPWLRAILLIILPMVYGYMFISPFSSQRGGEEGLAITAIFSVGVLISLLRRQMDARQRRREVGRSD